MSAAPPKNDSPNLSLIKRAEQLSTMIEQVAPKISHREVQIYLNIIDGLISATAALLMDTARPKDDTTDLINKVQYLCSMLEQGANKLSHLEAQIFLEIVDGVISAINTENRIHLLAIIDQVFEDRSSRCEARQEYITYMDTKMMYGPSSKDQSIVWVLTPVDPPSSSAHFLSNFISPEATIQFMEKDEVWDITFKLSDTKHKIYTEDQGTDLALYTNLTDENNNSVKVYLVDSSSVVKFRGKKRVIIGATSDDVSQIYMWKIEKVHSTGTYTCLQTDAATDSSSCCSLT